MAACLLVCLSSLLWTTTGNSTASAERDDFGHSSPAAKGGAFIRCFPPGTLVLVAGGSTRPIEEVKEGDEVLADDPTDSGEPMAFKVAARLENFTEQSCHHRGGRLRDACGPIQGHA